MGVALLVLVVVPVLLLLLELLLLLLLLLVSAEESVGGGSLCSRAVDDSLSRDLITASTNSINPPAAFRAHSIVASFK